MKFGKKQSVPDESRRNTYKQFDSAGWREPSVLATFDAERKHLVAVRISLMSILMKAFIFLCGQ